MNPDIPPLWHWFWRSHN